MSDQQSDRQFGSDSATTYRLGTITVKPANSDSSAPYEYSDLDTGDGPTVLTIAIHMIHWPLYFAFFFPIQWMVRFVKWRFRVRRFTGTGRLVAFILDAAGNVRKVKFLTNYDRFVLYLRASRVFTPAEVFPFLPGSAPISESRGGQTRPLSDDWAAIKREVYRRDNYRCVNCGSGGGEAGDAELHADHVVPRSQDGVDEPQNLRTLCRACHEARHARIFS